MLKYYTNESTMQAITQEAIEAVKATTLTLRETEGHTKASGAAYAAPR